MSREDPTLNRRHFLKTAGAAGLGSVFASMNLRADEEKAKVKEKKQEEFPQVPRRKLGRTGVEVSSLGLGANRLDSQIILRSCLRWGISFVDTSNSYMGGESEKQIGEFISRAPELRKKLFIVTKASRARSIEDTEARLKTSLQRLNTETIDLYYGVHGLDEPEQLSTELKEWAEDAKKRGVIRYFGFSTHENMAENLMAAAKCGWVDALMTSYNFRLMQDEKMQQAVEACHKAGVGLIAMKTLGIRTEQSIETEADKKIAGHFLEKGYTQPQAAMKAVLADERIAVACVGMRSVAEVTSGAAAVLDKTELTAGDTSVLEQYARASCSGYCAGCGKVCNSALPEMPYISKIMRYLMYYNGYGDRDLARELYRQIPAGVRSRLPEIDYRAAEAVCPQKMPIGRYIDEAVNKLA